MYNLHKYQPTNFPKKETKKQKKDHGHPIYIDTSSILTKYIQKKSTEWWKYIIYILPIIKDALQDFEWLKVLGYWLYKKMT